MQRRPAKREAKGFDANKNPVPLDAANLQTVAFNASTDKVEVADVVANLVHMHPDSAIQVLTGVHGDDHGNIFPEKNFYKEDVELEAKYPQVTAVNLASYAELQPDGHGKINMLAYCHSTSSDLVSTASTSMSSASYVGFYLTGSRSLRGGAHQQGCDRGNCSKFTRVDDNAVDLLGETLMCDMCSSPFLPEVVEGQNCRFSVSRKLRQPNNSLLVKDFTSIGGSDHLDLRVPAGWRTTRCVVSGARARGR